LRATGKKARIFFNPMMANSIYSARGLVDLAAAALRRVEALTGSALGKPRPAAG